MLEEVAAWCGDGSSHAAVEGELGAAHGVNDDTGAVWTVLHAHAEFDVEGDVTEAVSFHAEEAELVVVEPWDVVAWANVHVVSADFVVQLAGDGCGFADFLAGQAGVVEHVQEVGVSADVELVGVLEFDTAVFEETGEDTVNDGCTDLALDVVSEDGDACIRELLGPHWVACDEDGEVVDDCDAGLDGAFAVEFNGLLATYWEVEEHDVDFVLLEHGDNVDGFLFAYEEAALVWAAVHGVADTVEGVAHVDGCSDGAGEFADGLGDVGFCEDGFGKVLANFAVIDVETTDEVDVADVVAAEVDVHQSGDTFVFWGVFVVLDTFY